jgi:hypothetical protein
MLKKFEHVWGLTPAASAPSKCDTLNRYYVILAPERRGGKGGQALFPPYITCSFLFYLIKGILQRQ